MTATPRRKSGPASKHGSAATQALHETEAARDGSEWPPSGGVLGLPPLPAKTGPSKTVTRADAVYQVIHSALKRGEYPTGTRLIEGNVAAALNVSRTPVREALRRLEGDGLVRTGNGRGYIVADLFADAEHVFLIRERLEGLGAALAAQHITSAELNTLRTLVESMETLLEQEGDNRPEMARLNSEFHSKIIKAARSPRLERMVTRLHPEYLSYQVVLCYDDKGLHQSLHEHRGIVDALWNRNAELADTLVQAHFEHGKTVVLRELGRGQESGLDQFELGAGD